MNSARSSSILIVGNWCRPLAQSASRGGIEAVVLDLFADSDTRRYARAAHCVADVEQRHIDIELAACLAQRFGGNCNALVYAAGFERDPEALLRIAAGRRIFGNSAASVHAVKEPAALCTLLRQVGLPHPDTRMYRPEPASGWLVKRAGEQGGAHVLPLTHGHHPQPGHYFQRRVDGTPCSALFIADGTRARIIAFNEQLSVAVGEAPYCYGGAAGPAPLPHAVTADIAAKLDTLVLATGLVGLNSIDFIVSGTEYCVLEINPRPSATMDLYDADCPGGLLAWHMDACSGKLARTPLRTQTPRAHAVAYAQRAGQVPGDFIWPNWCSDLTQPGALIAAQTPVCIVHATAATPADTRALLLERRQTILQALAVD